MSTIRYRDSEKSINNSAEDYLTLKDYNDSFYNSIKTSQLRMTIAPGTVKYFNQAFAADRPNDSVVYASEASLTPLRSNDRTYDDQCDYATYPKLS